MKINTFDRLILFFLFFCFFITFFAFGDAETGSSKLQAVSVVLLFLSGALCLLKGLNKSYPISVSEGLFIFSSIYSLIVTLFIGNAYNVLYSLVMLFVVLSVMLIIRSMEFEQIVGVFTSAIIFVILVSVSVEYEQLVDALSVTMTDKGLVRFTPFNMHPNLVGLVYGSSFLLLLATAFITKTKYRTIFFIFSFISIIFVLAASSRASLLGLALAIVLVFLKTVNLRFLFRKDVVLLFFSLILGSIWFSNEIFTWLGGMLEFESDSRGVGAGASGRTDIWRDGFELFTNDLTRFVWGHGFRSIYDIGFPLENSYLNILLELGLFCGSSVIFVILFITLRSYFSLTRSDLFYKEKLTYFSALLLFIVFQSVFNRYLVGIGNMTSLLVLFLLFGWRKYVP